jgi:hypothetical protein
MPDRHLNLVYKLDGNVKEIDVFKLAPTLLALGELIQESNREINPDGRQIGVNVKPFREGSFIVDLTIFPSSNIQQVIDLLTPHSLEQLKTLLEVIGLISTGVGVSVVGAVKAIKWLKGKPKSIEEVKPGEFRYTTIDDKSFTVNGPVHKILSNNSITTNIFKIYGTPLEEMPSVTDVETYIDGDDSTKVQVTRDEIPAIREFANPAALPSDVSETVKESLQSDVYLNPKRVAVDGDPRDWSFHRGESIITATIKDKDFMERCAKGEYRLHSSDLLTVDLLEKQRVTGTKVMKPTYEIIKVKSYILGMQQKELDLE